MEVGLQAGRLNARIDARDHLVGEHAQGVKAGEEGVDDLGARAAAALADSVKYRFHRVGEACHLLVADGGAGTLERVGGAENLLEQVRIRLAFKLQQRVVEQLDLIVCLFAEELQVVIVEIELQALAFSACHAAALLVVRRVKVEFGAGQAAREAA